MPSKAQTPFPPPSPGQVLKQHIVDGERISQDALAIAMGVSRLTVNQIINGKRTITPEMALRLGRVLRTSAEFWLDLQRAVDLFEARQVLANDLRNMPVLRKTA